MRNLESPPLVRVLESDEYTQQVSERVTEEAMYTDRDYLLIAKLLFSDYGQAGEFQARLLTVEPHDIGRASLLLLVMNPRSDVPLAELASESTNGFITVNAPRRIQHARLDGLGKITHGYLINKAL